MELVQLEQLLLEPLLMGSRMTSIAKDTRRVVALVVGAATLAAAAAVVSTVGQVADALEHHSERLLVFLVVSILLQLFTIRLPGRGGSIGVSAVGLIATGIVLGSGPAMVVGMAAALAQWLRSRGMVHRALFDAANFVLSAGAAALTYHSIVGDSAGGSVRIIAGSGAGLTYVIVNNGLLCVAMGASANRSPIEIWRNKFQWASAHFLAFGPLGLLAAAAYTSLGPAGLAPFAVAPILLADSMRKTLSQKANAALSASGPRANLPVRLTPDG